jgi:carbon monoxide dehydrogenase subunit G
MPVKLKGEHTFAAPRELVWEALNDPDVLARTLPGCEKLERVEDNRMEGAIDIKVGPVQGKFQGGVTLSDVDPGRGYSLHLKGTGAPGFVDGKGTVAIEDAPADRAAPAGTPPGTILRYDVDAQVGGRIAGVGQRLLDSSARVIARQAIEGLDRQISARAAAAGARVPGGAVAAAEGDGGGAAAAAPAEVRAPSQAEFAADFAKGLAGELVPPGKRPWVIGIGAAVVLAVVLLAVRGCGG